MKNLLPKLPDAFKNRKEKNEKEKIKLIKIKSNGIKSLLNFTEF